MAGDDHESVKPVRFGKYSLLDRISHGGMAEVFRAKTFGAAGFERTVAIKLLLPTVAMDHEFVTMLIDEAKIAGQLTHANIAQIFDLGKTDGRYYIVQEYVDGRDLRAILKHLSESPQKALSVAQACHVMLKVCEGLEYAHNKRDPAGRALNLVHRDISPQNVVISREGEIKLIDFGIAKAEGRATRTLAGLVKGKFAYMSPEQIRGLPVDRRSDVFACGIVLWELLTGEPLFRRKSEFETLKRARGANIEPPSSIMKNIPPELDTVVLKALARHVEDRYPTAISFRDGLWEFVRNSSEFYSRNDMASWMRSTFAEDEETGHTAEQAAGRLDEQMSPDTQDSSITPIEDMMAPGLDKTLTPNPEELVSLLDAAPTPNEMKAYDGSSAPNDDDDLDEPSMADAVNQSAVETHRLDAPTPYTGEAEEEESEEDLEGATLIDSGLADQFFASSHSGTDKKAAPQREGRKPDDDPSTVEMDPNSLLETGVRNRVSTPMAATPMADTGPYEDSGTEDLTDYPTRERKRTDPRVSLIPPAAAPFVSKGGDLAAPVEVTGNDPQQTIPLPGRYRPKPSQGPGMQMAPPMMAEPQPHAQPYTAYAPTLAAHPAMSAPGLPGVAPAGAQWSPAHAQGLPPQPYASQPFATPPREGMSAAAFLAAQQRMVTDQVDWAQMEYPQGISPRMHQICVLASVVVFVLVSAWSITLALRQPPPAQRPGVTAPAASASR